MSKLKTYKRYIKVEIKLKADSSLAADEGSKVIRKMVQELECDGAGNYGHGHVEYYNAKVSTATPIPEHKHHLIR